MRKLFFAHGRWLCICLIIGLGTGCRVLNAGQNGNTSSQKSWIVEAKIMPGANIDQYLMFGMRNPGAGLIGVPTVTGIVYRLNSRQAALQLRDLLASSGFCEQVKLFAADE